jgi:gas vesicle protein GvpN
VATILRSSPRRFVSTPAIERLTARALRYLQSGFPVHLRGPAGTGKTTLSLHLADLLQRPMMLMFGDDEAKSSDMIGKQSGYTHKKLVDNYIHSVLKVEDSVRHNWVDSRLTLACREGYTLIYDEFNRSRPEVNNILLSVLEEKILILPPESNGVEYVKVNPNFRAIFTSNPEEYCGVHSTQDALMDRLITIDVPEPDELTQQEIVIQKTELDRATAITIVNIVRAFREGTQSSSTHGIGASGLRSCLMIAKICKDHELEVSLDNPEFRDLCIDILRSRSPLSVAESTTLLWDILRPESNIINESSVLRELVPVVSMSIVDVIEEPINELIEQPIEESIEFSIAEAVEELVQASIVETLESFIDVAFEQPIEETIVRLDDETMQAVLDEAQESGDFAELASSLEFDFFEAAPPEAELLGQLDGFDEFEDPIVAVESDELVEFTLEDQLHLYLKSCENGARLSQIESDLSLPRSKVVESIRNLAKSDRLAQRDRHFFAIG